MINDTTLARKNLCENYYIRKAKVFFVNLHFENLKKFSGVTPVKKKTYIVDCYELYISHSWLFQCRRLLYLKKNLSNHIID